MPALKLVTIHLGVGQCRNETKSLGIARDTCEKTFKLSDGHLSAEEAVVHLVSQMEDEPSLNCGYGSNLNLDGEVECDASLMCDREGIWTGVGAIVNCKNPIKLAQALYKSQELPRHLDLIQPNLLVGYGARAWMKRNRPDLIMKVGKLVHNEAFNTYQKNKSLFDRDQVAKSSNMVTTNRESFQVSPNSLDNQNMFGTSMDTVGAIAVDCDDNFACATSSGGLALKYSGRLGQAAVPGAGCWVENKVAVTTTGVGEALSVNLFAKDYVDRLSRQLYGQKNLDNLDLDRGCLSLLARVDGNRASQASLETIDYCFKRLQASPAIAYMKEKSAGLLAVSRSNDNNLTLTFGHNAEALCVGYMAAGDTVARATVLRGAQNKSSYHCLTISPPV